MRIIFMGRTLIRVGLGKHWRRKIGVAKIDNTPEVYCCKRKEKWGNN